MLWAFLTWHALRLWIFNSLVFLCHLKLTACKVLNLSTPLSYPWALQVGNSNPLLHCTAPNCEWSKHLWIRNRAMLKETCMLSQWTVAKQPLKHCMRLLQGQCDGCFSHIAYKDRGATLPDISTLNIKIFLTEGDLIIQHFFMGANQSGRR